MSNDQPLLSASVFTRPNFQLRSLPVNFRWEVTRRHALYQIYWTSRVSSLELPEDDDATLEELVDGIAFVALAKIGITGERPDPALNFDDLDESTFQESWLSGSIEPITNRGLVKLLIASLPKATLKQVGTAMVYASLNDGESHVPNKLRQLNELTHLDAAGMDDLLDEPIVSINPSASVRQVQSDLNAAMTRWKEERGLSDDRPQASKYAEYLDVWDAREGFVDGRYDRARESSLKEIARANRKSQTTVHNQYRSAFKLITGHDYSIENWITIFGHLKLTSVFGDVGRASARAMNHQTVRDAPESRVSPSGDFSIANRPASDTSDWREIAMDINSLLGQGKTDEQIVESLSLRYPEIVAELRRRREDNLI